MKKLVVFGLIFAVAGMLFAQSLTDPNPETVGADSAMLSLREVSVDKFERKGSWYVHISPDDGTIAARLFEGSPAMKEPLKEDEGKEDEDTLVLGVRVDFFRRGLDSFTIMAGRPMPVEGTVKTAYVNGRYDLGAYVAVTDGKWNAVTGTQSDDVMNHVIVGKLQFVSDLRYFRSADDIV